MNTIIIMSFIGPYTSSFIEGIRKELHKESTQKKIIDSTVKPILDNLIKKYRIYLSIIVFVFVFILSILIFNTYQLSLLRRRLDS